MTSEDEGGGKGIEATTQQTDSSMQMALLDELTSLVSQKRAATPRRAKPRKKPPVSLDPEYDPDTLDLFSELEAELDHEDELTDEAIGQVLSQLLDRHRAKIESTIKQSIIQELESILATLDREDKEPNQN
jgi:hypothetical protein